MSGRLVTTGISADAAAVSDPIDSAGWTGPPESMSAPGRAQVFTHGVGQHQVASDYQRLAAAQAEFERIPAEVTRARIFAAILFLSPIMLWLSHWALAAATAGLTVQDNSYVLILAGVIAVGLAVLLFKFSSLTLVRLRKAVAILGIVAILGLSGAYAYVGGKAYAGAKTSSPARAFVAGNKDRVNFELEDGSLLIGGGRGQPRASGNCVSVVVLTGEYGFSWVRVVEAVPRQRHQLFWPIRREDCFSDKPLASFAS